MIERVVCPFHEERTPSCVIYPDGKYHSFCCGRHGLAKDLGYAVPQEATPKYVEDLSVTVPAILELPVQKVRGLALHASDDGYYILWPDRDYYKFRSYRTDVGGAKYKGPAGVPKPMFKANIVPSDRLVIVEGEINSLSLAKVRPDLCVVSPGGAGDFYSKRTLNKDLEFYRRYRSVVIIVDADKAGAVAAIQLKAALMAVDRTVEIKMMSPDANDLLVQSEETLKEETERMGL